MYQPINHEYVLCIDTDAYAGNFERPMTAFITGVIGECGVGLEAMHYFFERVEEDGYEEEARWFDEFVTQESDNHGTHRPCSIYLTPGTKAYNSVGIFLSKFPSKVIFDFIKKKAIEFVPWWAPQNEWHYPFKILKIRLIKEEIKQTTIKHLCV